MTLQNKYFNKKKREIIQFRKAYFKNAVKSRINEK